MEQVEGHGHFFNEHTSGIVRGIMSCLVVGSVASSAALICKHLRLRRAHGASVYVVRILLMVPIFSIQALLALAVRAVEFNKALELMRKAYECVVIFAFLQLLVCSLGGISRVAHLMVDEDCKHLPPVSWLIPDPLCWAPPKKFLRNTLHCALQYVVVTLISALVGICSSFWMHSHPLIFDIVQTLSTGTILASQGLAMYGLILFYHGNHARFEGMRPISKFVAIKFLVIVTMWQDALFKVAVYYHAFKYYADHSKSHPPWTEDQIAEGTKNALLIVEMFLLSLWHHCVYPPGETPGEVAFEAETPTGTHCRATRQCVRVCTLQDIFTFRRDLKRMTIDANPAPLVRHESEEPAVTSADRGSDARIPSGNGSFDIVSES